MCAQKVADYGIKDLKPYSWGQLGPFTLRVESIISIYPQKPSL